MAGGFLSNLGELSSQNVHGFSKPASRSRNLATHKCFCPLVIGHICNLPFLSSATRGA
jgi:hypothetical protein